MQSHVKPSQYNNDCSVSARQRPQTVSALLMLFIESSQFVYLVCPSDADSNSWESENIISQAANG